MATSLGKENRIITLIHFSRSVIAIHNLKTLKAKEAVESYDRSTQSMVDGVITSVWLQRK